VRSIVVSGAGKMFTSGIDISDHADLFGGGEKAEGKDVARKAFHARSHIGDYQDTFTAIEKCPKPTLAAVHHGCIGGGVDLATACDMRVCTKDAFFCVKEVDVGLTADVGTLQRLPKVSNTSHNCLSSSYQTSSWSPTGYRES
jgi:Delta3,5-Delta2,4-dienoyl-CoA isomerase